jgi:acyl-CoA synthetase (NDP forming)
MAVNFAAIDALFATAEREGRASLFEHEVYALLREAGMTTPRVLLVEGRPVSRLDLEGLGTESLVLKVVSPLVVHKTDAGGVAFVRNDAEEVNREIRRMVETVPDRFVAWSRAWAGPKPERVPAPVDVAASIRGVLVCEAVPFARAGFGSELLLGVRNSREFGPVLTFGAGGLDVEYLGERLKPGRAAAMLSPHLVGRGGIMAVLAGAAVTDKLIRPFRGRPALVGEDVLAETAARFAEVAAHYSPYGEGAFVIEEAEINPLVVRDGALVPLDGVCRFSRRGKVPSGPPAGQIRSLLEPESIGIIGVSEKMNIGRIILDNILKNGFAKENVFVVKPGAAEIEGCRCVPTVADLPRAVDMFVLTLAADQCYDVMKDLVEREKARSVIIIAGGMGEKAGSQSIEARIKDLLGRGRREGKLTPVVNGGNCLGISSVPGRFDTTFIPDRKLPRPKGGWAGLVYLSQSGAFMIARMNALMELGPRYGISLGNQLDLRVSDYLNYLKGDPEAKLIAVYVEGFQPGDGLATARAAREILSARDRMIVLYKAGRTAEGRAATSSHTASVAGDYGIAKAVLEEAGVVVADDIREFETWLRNAPLLAGKAVRGAKAGLVSNAGFECVIMSDMLSNGERLALAGFGATTRARINEALRPLGIDKLQDVHNPLDVTPVADDAAFAGCVEAVLADPDVDCAVVSNVPMTPAMQTLPAGEGHAEDFTRAGTAAARIIDLFRGTDKPFVVNIDAGEVYDPLAGMFAAAGVPVFRRCDEAVRFLRRYVNHRLR